MIPQVLIGQSDFARTLLQLATGFQERPDLLPLPSPDRGFSHLSPRFREVFALPYISFIAFMPASDCGDFRLPVVI
jgi:hypothetical protein